VKAHVNKLRQAREQAKPFLNRRYSMPAYVIVRVHVTDWERYREYTKQSPATITQFEGQFLARGGETVTLEGPAETGRVVILEFPTLRDAQQWYHSDEYQAAKEMRSGAATASFVAVDGFAS
jgi:uncharacterized protein (DUF1330 family)